MANNQKKLKAFVRYDGSGRVVAGSLILRKNKPRVGRWFEIPSYDCCNDTTTSTTTGGVTPTSFTRSYWANPQDGCSTTAAGNLVFYSASSTIAVGISIFQDAQLTIPVAAGIVIQDNMIQYQVDIVGAGVLVLLDCR